MRSWGRARPVAGLGPQCWIKPWRDLAATLVGAAWMPVAHYPWVDVLGAVLLLLDGLGLDEFPDADPDDDTPAVTGSGPPSL